MKISIPADAICVLSVGLIWALAFFEASETKNGIRSIYRV